MPTLIARTMLLFPLLAGGAWSVDAHAQSWRCGNDLANVGDSTDDVQRKCGEPPVKKRSCEVIQYTGENTGCVDVETWTYRPGYGQFTTKLVFEDDRLVKIVYGDRQ